MKSFPVGEFKASFSDIMAQVRAGEEIMITYGKKKEKLAVIVPYASYKGKSIKLGLLKDKTLTFNNFEMTEDELLDL